MKQSSLTLDDVRKQLPYVIRERYQDPFLFAVGNEILSDVEKECDPRYYTDESVVLTQNGVTRYTLPPNIRHIRGLYQVPCNNIEPDHSFSIPSEILDNWIRLHHIPQFSANTDLTATIAVADANADVSRILDTQSGNLTPLLQNALVSRIVRVTHVNGLVEWRIIISNTQSEMRPNGNFLQPVTTGDVYLVSSNYLILEFTKYLTRFTATTDLLPTPQEFDSLMRAGVTYKCHFAADEVSQEAISWGQIYANELDKYGLDVRKKRGDVPEVKPRHMPQFY